MLYLSRKEGQSFFLALSSEIDPEMKVKDLLSKPIRIELSRMSGGVAQIGIDAPRVFNIAREEVYDEDKTLTIEVQGVGE